MMPAIVTQNPIKETLTPDPDDVTVKFYTSQDFRPGTVSVWQNGIKVIDEWDDGFTETGDDEITMNEAPLTGDSMQVEYEPL